MAMAFFLLYLKCIPFPSGLNWLFKSCHMLYSMHLWNECCCVFWELYKMNNFHQTCCYYCNMCALHSGFAATLLCKCHFESNAYMYVPSCVFFSLPFPLWPVCLWTFAIQHSIVNNYFISAYGHLYMQPSEIMCKMRPGCFFFAQ